MFKTIAQGGTVVALAALLALPASAATTAVVSPSNTNGWSTSDTRPGGEISFSEDATSPYPDGALSLVTDGTNEAKAQYMHEAHAMLSDVSDLSYSTKQVSGPAVAAPSYQLLVDLNGTTTDGGFTTLVYEPYWNGTVQADTWQQWDVDEGQLWSSRTVTIDGDCSVVAGAGGAPFYAIGDLQESCPDAEVLGFGVNVGTYNPDYEVYTDGVVFNETLYDFQLDPVVPLSKDECKKGGWANFTDPTFKNQGQCVSFVATQSHQ